MAFLKDFGKAENDQGEWVEAGRDGDRIVKIRVRACPDEVVRALMRKYTTNKEVTTNEGVRTVQPVARDWQDNVDFLNEQAKWCLVDSEELYVTPADDESARFYGKALGRVDQIHVGEEVCLDGHLTDPIKENLLRKNTTFRQFVLAEANAVAKRANQHIKVLEGNS